jgi:hypothetical protein
MYTFSISTLIDITSNGNLKKTFPFKTDSGELVHDAHSLEIAKNQNTNFTTLIQLLQIRGNIIWDDIPHRQEIILNQQNIFGRKYEGKANLWTFEWEVEQSDVYNNFDEQCGSLINDFDSVPIINFCKETVTFPSSSFITNSPDFTNTVFNYKGPTVSDL